MEVLSSVYAKPKSQAYLNQMPCSTDKYIGIYVIKRENIISLEIFHEGISILNLSGIEIDFAFEVFDKLLNGTLRLTKVVDHSNILPDQCRMGIVSEDGSVKILGNTIFTGLGDNVLLEWYGDENNA